MSRSSSPEAVARTTARRRRKRVIVTSMVALTVLLLGAAGTAIAAVMTQQQEPEAVQAEPSSSPEPSATVEREEFRADEPAAANGAEPCLAVRVLSSFENAEMVERLTAAYNAAPRDIGGSCVTATSSKAKSGTAALDLSRGFPNLADGTKPTLWIPDSDIWLDVASTSGAGALTSAGSAGSSAIVLAMPQPLAEASGWTADPPTWEQVFADAENTQFWSDHGHAEWGAFKLGKTSPVVATSGAAAMYASYGSSAGAVADLQVSAVTDPTVVAEVKLHELATSHYMATPEHFLWHAREAESAGSSADFLSAVIVDEKSVWDYNRGITSRDGVTRVQADPPLDPLVPVYPADGTYAADNPIVPLSDDAATADFVRFITTVEGQVAVRDGGYRDRNGELEASVASVGGLQPTVPITLAMPSADVVAAVNAAFPDVRKRANVLFLVDASGSMDEPISPTDTKLTAAKNAIEMALDHFTPGDNVGLAAFAQSPATGQMVPGTLAPLADIATERPALVGALSGLQSMGDTPLYEAVDTYAKDLSSRWQADRINAIVLLSDGENDVNTATTTVETMNATLEHMHHGGTPVLVFTLAYGADADVATLQHIASMTGAHYYDATDPTKVEEVLGDLVTSF